MIRLFLFEHVPDSLRQRIGSGAGLIFPIHLPPSGVFDDVLADGVQGAFVADDVFVIILLPDDVYVSVLPHPFGDTDFEPPDNRPDGFGGAAGAFGGR